MATTGVRSLGICNLQVAGIETRKEGNNSVQGMACLPLLQRLGCRSGARTVVRNTLPSAVVRRDVKNNDSLQCARPFFFCGEDSLQCAFLAKKKSISRVRSTTVCVVEEAPVVVTESSSPAAAENNKNNNSIWMSDVVVRKRRPYFLNRKWSSKDVIYGGFMVFMHALCLLAPFTFSWSAFGVFMALYVITGMFGITLSFHRNLSHKSFKLPKWLEYTFAYCGVQALQGDPLEWVSSHRYHHQFCDTEMDPHTPYEGFWHSHMGWLLDEQPLHQRVGERGNIGDMEKDRFYQFIQKTYPIHPVMMAVALYAAGGVPYIVWGVAVRAVWVYHITWFVNSASHVWGTQVWNTGDLSRNNWLVSTVIPLISSMHTVPSKVLV
jgi:fatty-acid desaturase